MYSLVPEGYLAEKKEPLFCYLINLDNMTKKDAVSIHMASAYQKNLKINHIIINNRNYSAC